MHHSTFIFQVQLNNETLKSAMVHMIANCDLPFAIVEQKSFQELLQLLNKNAVSLVNSTNQASIATHILHM